MQLSEILIVLVTPAMKRSTSLIALSMERQGYEPPPGVAWRRIED